MAKTVRTITTLNGAATKMAIVCRAANPSEDPPLEAPTNNSTPAMAPSITAQNTRLSTEGLAFPPVDSMLMTNDAESELVTKKTTMRIRNRPESTGPPGRMLSIWNRASLVETAPSLSMKLLVPWICCQIAVPPMTENHRAVIMVGTSMTPRMNSRMVRPREIRAMNTPTKGDQLIHQPQ